MSANGAKHGQKKDRPYCTYCKYQGHTVEKYYKLHGYPLSFRQKLKSSSEGNNSVMANQVNTLEDKSSKDNDSIANFFQNLDNNQCHHLMNILSKRMASTFQIEAPADHSPISHNTGTCFSVSVHPKFASSNSWIIDSGASKHICTNAVQFISLQPLMDPKSPHLIKLLSLFFLLEMSKSITTYISQMSYMCHSSDLIYSL